LKDLGIVDGTVILKRVLEKYGVEAWTEFISFRIG
jgi:hypothetical protein